MRKFLLLLSMALTFSATTFAQKVDVKGTNAKLKKFEEDVVHPKKGLKAATWIGRGDAYLDALLDPTKMLYIGMEQSQVAQFIGAGKKVADTTVDDKVFSTYNFGYFTLYYNSDMKVASWKVTRQLNPKSLAMFKESYLKALELDPNSMEKVKKSLDKAINYYKQRGSLYVTVKNMQAAAAEFVTVTELQALLGEEEVDPVMLFYAGYMYTMEGENNPDLFAKGEGYLNRALERGYNDYEDAKEDVDEKERGNLYYYLYHASYGDRERHPEKLQAAKGYLAAGIEKYPQNNRIFEGLIQLYTSEEGMGDPSELLATIEKTIASDPTSVNAWFGRGRVYFALKNNDECVASFAKVAELVPDRFDGHFYLGLFTMLQGDEYLEVVRSKDYTDQASYNADEKILNAKYGTAIPHFERAHEINPKDAATLDYLKQICFRLRDDAAMMEKYTKYNTLLKEL